MREAIHSTDRVQFIHGDVQHIGTISQTTWDPARKVLLHTWDTDRGAPVTVGVPQHITKLNPL